MNSVILPTQLNIIRDQCERVKELIAAHENEGRESIELYLQDLRVKREELETLKSVNSQFLQDNNVVEIIQGGRGRLGKMKTTPMSYDSQPNIPDIEHLKGKKLRSLVLIGRVFTMV